MNLPTREEWEEQGFKVPAELCQASQRLQRPCPFCGRPVRMSLDQKFATLDHDPTPLGGNVFCRLLTLHVGSAERVEKYIRDWEGDR